MTGISVEYRGGDRFDIGVGRHVVVVDQPAAEGGGDAGPTPTELFVASLAACVGHYARRFLARHGIPADGLRVAAEFEMSRARPVRVAAVTLDVVVLAELPPERVAALTAVVSHCTVHNSINRAPEVGIRVMAGAGVDVRSGRPAR